MPLYKKVTDLKARFFFHPFYDINQHYLYRNEIKMLT